MSYILRWFKLAQCFVATLWIWQLTCSLCDSLWHMLPSHSTVPHFSSSIPNTFSFSRKGISQSALPYRRSVPTWLKLSGDDVQEQIYKLAKKGLTPSQIGKTIFSVLLPKFPIRILYLSNIYVYQVNIHKFSSFKFVVRVKNLYFPVFKSPSCSFMNGCFLLLIQNFFIS